MVRLLCLLPFLLVRVFRSRHDLLLENLALRQQLGLLRRKHPRPQLAVPDKFFWVMLRRLWPGWKRALILVQPETVVRGETQHSPRLAGTSLLLPSKNMSRR